MAIIYLVRHGKTDFIGKKLCGNLPGIHLNEEGRGQAQKAADYLSSFPIKAIYSSPMERACETAAPLAKALNLEVIPQDFLREINFGDFQGMGDELFSNPIWQQFNEHPADVQFPNGDNTAQAQSRVSAGLDVLSQKYQTDDHIVCFAHCEILRLGIAAGINLPREFFHRITVDPASISILEWSPERKKLRLLNFQPTH
ncbi:MAG: hypothetical protein C0410_04600 [Anaerolinea sp.]|nr:hypothetical protein [Anaerolinea sp.]